jgi:DNA-binding MarR family transcriptional regulator
MKNEYTAAEDIRDVLQLITLVNERPCLTKHAERGTAILYRELFAAKKRLEHALGIIEADIPKKTDEPRVGGLTKQESRVVTRLYVRQQMTTSELASELNMSPAKMLEVLQVMQGLGVVESNMIPEFEDSRTLWRIVPKSGE